MEEEEVCAQPTHPRAGRDTPSQRARALLFFMFRASTTGVVGGRISAL